MKDFVLELVSSKKGYNAKINIMREYLQAYILRILYEGDFLSYAAFVGGTALRFLYGIPRFSQDLDFSLAKNGPFPFDGAVEKVKHELALAGYEVAVAQKTSKTVYSAMIKFKNLMYEAKLSPLPDENFSIKIEIDRNPPEGATLASQVVNKYFILSFVTYDVPSLFAGKIHAVLSRKYTKGRDLFDVGWYMSKWEDLNPNINFLNNALKQTGWNKEIPTEGNWRGLLCDAIEAVDWNTAKKDFESFLENPSDADIFNKENIINLIKR